MAARDHFRAHARRRVELGATLRLRDDASRQDVKIRDLGLGGVGIEVSEPSGGEQRAPIALDTSVTIELMAPSLWDPLTLSGKIAWVKRAGQGRAARAGVRFEHGEPGALFALFQLLGAQAHDAS